jgi:NADH-quinone oxidoreductase subunit G
VFPVAPVSDKAGMFVTWEGRVRSFDPVFSNPNSLPDLRILAGIAEELGAPLGFRNPAQVRSEMEQVGPWDGDRAVLPPAPAPAERKVLQTKLTLATWKQMLDNGSMQDGDDLLRETARAAVARIPRTTHEMLNGSREITLTGDRGSVTLPVEVADLPEGVVWVPANSFGNGVLADLSSPGGMVSVKGDR